ncbi:hypothetical protein GCM10027446_00930 [Angustibacter peucedani]
MTCETAADALPQLLTGDLDRAETREVVEHLRGCADCRSALVDLTAAHAALRSAGRLVAPPDRPSSTGSGFDVVDLPALPVLPRRRWSGRRLGVAAAALALVAGGAGAGAAWTASRSQPARETAVRVVVLQPVAGQGDADASGRVTMSSPGEQTRMSISTSGLPAATSGHFYYAWLLDPATNKMLPLGVVSSTSPARFAVSRDLVARYHAVDISLQADDGDPAHSATSVLRAAY